MRKYLAILLVVITGLSCRTEGEETAVAPTDELAFDVQTLPKMKKATGKAAAAVNSWAELRSFDQSLERIYKVGGREEYLLVVEELLELFEVMGASEGPETLQSPQIISRFNVVKTYLLKLKADLEYRTDPEESTLELIDAYSAAMDQCNTLVNTTLDPKTLFDE